MSVRTKADELILDAKENINAALRALTEATDDDTWGSNEFNDDYNRKLDEAIAKLRDVRRALR
jgi:hypothetical protein